MDATHFLTLARKVAQRQASAQERDQLEQILRACPELNSEFDDIKRECGWQEVGRPGATALAAPDIDDDAEHAARDRAALEEERAFKRQRRTLNWRRWLKLASIAVALVVIFWPEVKPPARQAVVALNIVRGTNTPPEVLEVETRLLKQTWPGVALTTADTSEGIKEWEGDWPDIPPERPIVKIIYDRPAAQLRISGMKGHERFQQTFAVVKGLPEALKEAHAYLAFELQ